mgnify:CR=1 FL=1
MNPFWTVSLFWIATVVCIVIALAFVLPALLRARAGAGKAARPGINRKCFLSDLPSKQATEYFNARILLECAIAIGLPELNMNRPFPLVPEIGVGIERRFRTYGI